MDLKVIVYLLTILTVAELRSPQVHEDIDETPSKEQESTNQRFKFETSKQADRQKWRYIQQQVVDARHQARNAVVAKNRKSIPKMPRKRDVNSFEKTRILSKTVNHGFEFFDNSKSLEESSQAQLEMLNSLVGQSPVLQLQGLQKLLNAKDHIPIMEDVVDVVNPLNHPNVKVEPAPPEYQEAVANALVLQANIQRKIKEHNQLALAEVGQQLGQPVQVPVTNEHQSQHIIVEKKQPEVHPTYGKLIGIQRKPSPSIYSEDQDNVSIFEHPNGRTKRESDCEEDDWYVDYDFDNFTSDKPNSSLSENYEYFYEVYNDVDVQNLTEADGDNRRHYKIVEVPTIVKETKRLQEHDPKPLNYIVINNNNGDHQNKHKIHKPFPKHRHKKRKFKKRPHFTKTSRNKKENNIGPTR